MRHTSAGAAEEHILSFSPNDRIRPVIIGSEFVYQGGLTIDGARNRAASLGLDVVGGVNANFFNSDMTPIGMQIQGGVLVSYNRSNSYLPSLGFDYGGNAIVGDPGLQLSVSKSDGSSVIVDSLNHLRAPDRIFMYTRRFSETTRTTAQGLHVVIKGSGTLGLGRSVEGTVTQVLRGTAAHTIAADEFVLSATSAQELDRLAFLNVGDSVVISAECTDGRWNGINSSIAGLRLLVRDGQAADTWAGTRAPRTSAGVRADGSVVLYTVDGRQSGYSAGLSLGELAARMIDLGCVSAIELDGGGSTSITARMPGETESRLVNRPSDGRQRRCANYILLCNTAPPSDGRAAHLFPQPRYYLTMSNVTSRLPSILATDEHYRAVPVPSGWEDGMDSWSEDTEVAAVNGIWFTSKATGATTLHYTLGEAVGLAHVRVVSWINSFTLTDVDSGRTVRELSVPPEGQVRLVPSAVLDNMPVASTAWNFTWATDGGIGEISPDGIFTASEKTGRKGSITVSGGGQTVTLPVSVGRDPLILQDFDSELTYSFDDDSGNIGFNAAMTGNPSHLWVSVTGDGSGNELAVRTVNTAGQSAWTSLGKLDFIGAKYLIAPLPQETVSVTAFTVYPRDDEPTAGKIILHQVAAAWDDDPGTAPSVTISHPREEGGELVYTVTARDWNGVLPKEVTVTKNGDEIPVVWDDDTAQVRLPLPENGLYILTVSAMDSLGRRVQRISADYYGRRDDPFLIWDAADKWYTMYVDFLDDRGILDTDENFGLRYYRGEADATRLEVVKMMYRILDLPKGPGTLPFDDTGRLSAEEADAVSAVFAAGLVSGKTRPDGAVYLDPDALITRAELFTILNKTIPRGYEKSTLADFSDRSEVPSFALGATQTLVGMGIVSGSDGRLNPNHPIRRAEVCSILARLCY
jgi:hypothetical protein